MHKPEYFLENEMLKMLLDFQIQIDHPIVARRSDLVLINKKKELVICSEGQVRENESK